MRRRASPSPPNTITDAQLEKMSEAQIADRAAEHQAWLDRLANQPDPGQGLPAREAGAAREKHLKSIEKTAAEVTRLEAAIARDPFGPTTSHRNYEMNRNAIANAPRPEAEKQAMREMRENMLEDQHQRETKGKLRTLADRRKHPPDPKASSVLAAVLTSDFLKEALERKLRSGIVWIEDGVSRELPDGEHVTCRVLEAQDVGVLYLAGLAIEEGGLFSASTPADRGLHSLGDVPGSLRRLRMNNLLTVRREGDRRWRVAWGSRARSIAEKAGVKTLPPVIEEPVEEILTRS
jgi:hypothetical protein